MKTSEVLLKAKTAITQCNFLMITAGAGMGVDSGLPDFRGAQGFWKAYPIFARLGITFPQASNPSWFFKDPQLAWGFFGHRYNLYSSTSPHAGFSILKSWTQQKDYFIFTSNVDGQFQKAGFPEHKIVECHGSIHYLQCLETYKCKLDLWDMNGIEVNMEVLRAKGELPKCKNCGGLARPNILMFGDMGWVGDRTEAQMERLEMKISEKKWRICVIELGAGEAVYTVRAFGEKMLHRERAEFIRINPAERNGVEGGVINIGMQALEALKALDELMKN